MRRIVIDASSTLRWLFDEDAQASRVKSVLETSELIAPWLWRLEVTNAILVRERRRALTKTQSNRLLELIDELAITFVRNASEGNGIDSSATALAELARPHQLTAYDATYLAAALKLDLPLFTFDHNLQAASRRLGVKLVSADAK